MNSHFTPSFFEQNRKRLRELVGRNVIIIVAGNGAMQRGSDEPSPFHQDSNFWYLTGLNNPDLTLVMGPHGTYVMVPQMSEARTAFDGAHDVKWYQERSGIAQIVSEKEGWAALKIQLRDTNEGATLFSPAEYLPSHGIYTLPFRRRLIAKLRRVCPGISLRDIRTELAGLRVIKQLPELAALQQAIDVTAETLHEAASTLEKATMEFELEAALSYGFRKRGATGHSFTPIVASGAHSTTLHYKDNNGPIRPDDLVVLDVGAEVEHYAADISRTVSARPITGRKAEVFNAVIAVQEFALSRIKPGVLYREYESEVERFMGMQLQKIGLLTKPTHEAIRHYFPHATSHFLGLDVHDVGDYKQPWQAGMVITCEPGIYIPQEQIGVRIEDDVLIMKDGYQVLSAACPRELTHVQ